MNPFWKNILIVFWREFSSAFNSMLAYVFVAIFVVLSLGLSFMFGSFLDSNSASLDSFFAWHPWLFMILAPAIGVRLWSEEQRNGTVELLLTMPIATWQAIVGKFLASATVLFLALLGTFPIVLTINFLGNPDPGPILGGYIGGFLLGATFLAITSAVSALTRSIVACLVISVTICFLLILIGFPPVVDFISGFLGVEVANMVSRWSIFAQHNDLARGVIFLRNLVYFFSVIGFTLFLTSVIIREKRS